MAIYRFNVKHGSAVNIGKAQKYSDYIHALNDYAYKSKEIVYQNDFMPDWVSSPTEFFKLSEEKERINAITYKEFEIALINEISLEENINLLNSFLEKELENKYYYSAVIHNKETNLKDKTIQNIHAHVMFCTRELDGIKRDKDTFFKRANKKNKERGGAVKNEKWNSKNVANLYKLRKSWETEINNVLEKHNLEKVSCENLAYQRQQALLNDDIKTYNKLNRKPLNCDIRIINKVRKKVTLTKKEKTEYQEYMKAKKEKEILEEIYEIELQKEILLNHQEKIQNIDFNKNELEQEINNYSYAKEEYKNIIELENHLMNTKIEIEKIDIQKNNLKNLAIYKLYPEYEKLINEQQYYFDKLSYNFSDDEKHKFYIEKLIDCEKKLNNFSLNEDAIKIEIENISSDLDIQKKILSYDILYINSLEKNLLENLKDKDTISDIILEKNFYNNMTSLVDNMFTSEQSKREIEKIDNKLNKESLEEVAINIITKSDSRKINNQLKKYTNQKNILENELRNNNFSSDLRLKKEKELQKINDNLINLTKDYNALLEKLNTPENKSKIIKISSSIEKKLLAKKENLLDQIKINKENIKIYRTQTFDTIKNKEQLKLLEKNYIKIANLHEQNIKKYNIYLKTISSLKAEENLQRLAYNKLTNGRFYKLLSEYNFAKDALEKNKISLKKLGVFNFKEKKILTDEINNFTEKCNNLKKEYSDIINSIHEDKLNKAIEIIKNNYINAEKIINEKIREENNIKFENITKAKYIKDIKNELYKFTPKLYIEKVNLVKDLSFDDEGYSSNALGIEDKKYKKKKGLEISL